MKKLVVVLSVFISLLIMPGPTVLACRAPVGPCTIDGSCPAQEPEQIGYYGLFGVYLDGSCLSMWGTIWDYCDGNAPVYRWEGWLNDPQTLVPYWCPTPGGQCVARELYESGWHP